jgi:hypothetical protein
MLDPLPATHQRDILMHRVDEVVEEWPPNLIFNLWGLTWSR